MARITKHDEEWEVTPNPVTIPASPEPRREPDRREVPAEPQQEPEKVR